MSNVTTVKFHRANVDELIQTLCVDMEVQLSIQFWDEDYIVNGKRRPKGFTVYTELEEYKVVRACDKSLSVALQKAIKEIL